MFKSYKKMKTITTKINQENIKKIIDSKEYETLFKKLDNETKGSTPIFIILDIIKKETNLPDEECLQLLTAYSKTKREK